MVIQGHAFFAGRTLRLMRRVLLFLFLLTSAWLIGCTKKEVPKQSASLSHYADIRAVDFRNFDYPRIPGERDVEIHLRNGIHPNLFRDGDPDAEVDSPRNGEASLSQVLYGYDNEVEPIALVVVDVNAGGTMTLSELFLYKLVDGAPKLLWSFESGDRADGGLRTVYFEKGSLVLETYNEAAEDPLCCASYFTRHFYAWKNSDQLVELGKEEWIPLPKQPHRVTTSANR
jgi:hypothetical protein